MVDSWEHPGLSLGKGGTERREEIKTCTDSVQTEKFLPLRGFLGGTAAPGWAELPQDS